MRKRGFEASWFKVGRGLRCIWEVMCFGIMDGCYFQESLLVVRTRRSPGTCRGSPLTPALPQARGTQCTCHTCRALCPSHRCPILACGHPSCPLCLPCLPCPRLFRRLHVLYHPRKTSSGHRRQGRKPCDLEMEMRQWKGYHFQVEIFWSLLRKCRTLSPTKFHSTAWTKKSSRGL